MATAYKIQTLPKPFELIKKDESTENELNQLSAEVITLLGWDSLPERIKTTIFNDIRSFSNELMFNYTQINQEIRDRKKRIYYWIGQFKAGNCTEETAVEMLAN